MTPYHITTPHPIHLLARAKDLAGRAHAGQRDKAGRPYIEHVGRVAAAVAGEVEAEVVAWLHDVLEDCPAFAHELEEFPPPIRTSVLLLTRVRGQNNDSYYRRIAADRLALRVKVADIMDNANEARLALLDEETAARLRRKYQAALAALAAHRAETRPDAIMSPHMT